ENEAIDAFRVAAPAGEWHKISPAQVDLASDDRTPSDDWPQLYLRSAEIPWSPIGQGMVAVAVLSLVILLAFAPVRRVRPNWRMFFLGAGFMLLETKGVVHMALLFGSTWMVNSVVFFAILVMILCSNLYVLVVRPARAWPYYALVVMSLLVGMLIPIDAFLGLRGAARIVASCAVVFVPVFFAGIVFAATFRDSRAPDVDFGSNIAGAIVGGLTETLSLVVGFNALLGVAMVFYGLSWALGR